ncbi:hypothetical protein TTHERM_00856490 (macronuclear) [Tetrahymena thermophila SB210]|uniref:Uncharacterized protein n=1 Tax=Tetrahymena thermophila (strain SB210) TaxID=312017 RepID=Q23CK8_TETTS|nr:hypothetical protein TTHERM_00856490 [Tetrahymena thermophila SB210]EAR94272.2 hypothetical protein TTHERM_00856490 [Tetrahymena thermophila SB210]|eukprot:XP_001014517.2 hypothetical protein TTHERM_00856490 [Tetrahymena thermophila SB210]
MQKQGSLEDYSQLKNFLDQTLLQLGLVSARSKNTMSLFLQMSKLNEAVRFLDKIKDEDRLVVQQFYRVFRGLLKSYENNGIMSEVGLVSGFENLSDEYIVEIKEKLFKMTQGLTGLCNSIVNNTSVHLMWYFISPDQEDQQEMNSIVEYLSKTYQKKGLVKTYLDQEIFLKEMREYGLKQNPIIAFISCNNYNKQNEQIIDCIFNIQSLIQDHKDIKLQGLILQVDSEESFNQLKIFTQDISIKHEVTYDYFEIYNEVFKFMNPQEFRRVIPCDDINLYYHTIKEKFFKLHIDDFSKISMFDFEPERINLQNKLEQAIDIMKKRDIKVDKFILAPNMAQKLTNEISKQYQQSNKSEQKICEGILKLYTMESVGFYKFINGCLNTLNEDVVILIWDLVMMLRVALQKYDDTPYTKIQIQNAVAPKLFRGINLSQDYFNRIIKVGKIICLASFSSFTLSQDVALQFILQDENFSKDRASIIFEYEHKISTHNYPQRPKSVSQLSAYSKEQEYLLPPSYMFKIYKIDEPNNDFQFYKVYLTQGNQTSFQQN